MSKFKTSIPVDTKRITEALPKGSYIEGIEFNPKDSTVEVLWENDRLKTKFTFPSELKADDLPQARRHVEVALEQETATPPSATPEPGPVETPEESAKKQPGESAPPVAVPTAEDKTADKKRARK